MNLDVNQGGIIVIQGVLVRTLPPVRQIRPPAQIEREICVQLLLDAIPDRRVSPRSAPAPQRLLDEDLRNGSRPLVLLPGPPSSAADRRCGLGLDAGQRDARKQPGAVKEFPACGQLLDVRKDHAQLHDVRLGVRALPPRLQVQTDLVIRGVAISLHRVHVEDARDVATEVRDHRGRALSHAHHHEVVHQAVHARHPQATRFDQRPMRLCRGPKLRGHVLPKAQIRALARASPITARKPSRRAFARQSARKTPSVRPGALALPKSDKSPKMLHTRTAHRRTGAFSSRL
mmetsp:Transcript_4848/g.19401  ORF Transcript_4848/g.19401 Transcript_4848/m.19401 type:complete len:288 (+) Transcript_4848:3195-4058(+)